MATRAELRLKQAVVASGWRYWLAVRLIWAAACLVDGEVELKRK